MISRGDMTAKDLLRSAIEAKLESSRRRRRVEALESQCTRMTARAGSSPSANGGGGRTLEDLWVELADARSEEEQAMLEELAKYKEVEAFTDAVDSPTSRAILRLKYLEGLSWAEMQKQLYVDGIYYSERHLRRLHSVALEEAEELWRRWDHGTTE